VELPLFEGAMKRESFAFRRERFNPRIGITASLELGNEVPILKILLTGANGYIGKRLMFLLLEHEHEIYALVRSKKKLTVPERFKNRVHIIEADLLDFNSLSQIPAEIDAAYYLVHSMGTSPQQFTALEARSAENFVKRLSQTRARQIIYLSGLVNDEHLSKHLLSRKNVEQILEKGPVPVTTLMAGIIIGSGSASFEIIRDLVEKLPVMVAPKWVNSLTQPIAIRDVLEYLVLVLGHPECIGARFEIGGPDLMNYKQLLLAFSKIRHLKRWIITLPVLTPKLSSYWLYFITSASFPLARSLVESLKNNAICKEDSLQEIFPRKLLNFEEAVQRAFEPLEQDAVPSSWKEALGNSELNSDLLVYVTVAKFGTYSNVQTVPFSASASEIQNRVWSLGGSQGWGYMNWAWTLRGLIDKLVGGVGLTRGRTHPTRLKEGDAVDFWRVLIADSRNRRLLLYAEMKLPGEAWLEFKIEEQTLIQTAIFRPHGLFGRLYWILVYPFHWFIFRGMAKSLVLHPRKNDMERRNMAG
jgi:uncharacterized protein YbjT (DUF2867 family)